MSGHPGGIGKHLRIQNAEKKRKLPHLATCTKAFVVFCRIITKKEKIKVFFRKIWKSFEKNAIIHNAETKRFTWA